MGSPTILRIESTWFLRNNHINVPLKTGILKKNEYSKAVYLSSPRSIPVIVVIPDLEVPGIKATV